MLYRIACCDDEQQILDRLKECFVRLEVQTDIETQVDYYTDGRNLIQAYQADHSKYDIILLDMEMPLISGMQVAEQMRRINREVIIIFLTSYPEYMQQSFRVQPFQYLMKQLETDSFIKEIQNAMNYLRTDHHKILLHTEQGELLQSIDQILYIEKPKEQDKLCVHMTRDNYIVKNTLQELEGLLVDKDFIRVSRTHLVNLSSVWRLEKKEIHLENGECISVSRRKVKELQEQFTKYLVRKGGAM